MSQDLSSAPCPECGQPLGADAPNGLCPACLMMAGLSDSGPDSAPTREHDSGGGSESAGHDELPTVGDLARRFPQLEIERMLGRGGMGAVFLARQTALDRRVALKVLQPKLKRDPAFADRFAREAKAMARLTHPNIVVIYEFGEADGLYYLMMEYVDGVNLREAIAGGNISPEQALAIVPQICDALQFAHDEGIVHRDIKPENVLLDRRGRVKIADFGLAKLLKRSSVEITLTGTQQVMGTLHYMAPEQMERPAEVDHRADIYSLGVVFYELLTGQLPLGRFELPSRKVAVDARLDEIVLKSLEREPDARYQHASEVKTEVQQTVDQIPKSIHREPVNSESPQPRGKNHAGGRLAPLFATISGWTIVLSFCGALLALLPFMSLPLEFGAMQGDVIVHGYRTTAGQVALAAFLLVVVLTLVDGIQVKQIRLWRPLSSIVAGLLAGGFVLETVLRNPNANLLIGAWSISLAALALIAMGGWQCILVLAAKSDSIDEDDQRAVERDIDSIASALSIVGWLMLPAVLLMPFAFAAVSFLRAPPAGDLNIWVSVSLSLPLALCGLITIPIVLLAATRIRAHRSRWLGALASVLVMLPFTPAVLVGLPVGFWSLIGLARPRVISVFSSHHVAESDARDQANVAGGWLTLCAIFSIVSWIAFGVITPSTTTSSVLTWNDWIITVLTYLVIPAALLIIFSLQIKGARNLARQTHYGWSWYAAIVALLPISPIWPISLPVGLYAIAMLVQPVQGYPRVASLFRKSSSLPDKPVVPGVMTRDEAQAIRRAASGPANALFVTGVLNVLYFAAVVILVVMWISFMTIRPVPDDQRQGLKHPIESIEEVR